MSRYSTPFKIFVLALALTLPACYEGYKRPVDPSTHGDKPGGTGNGEKRFGLTLLDVFKPTADALGSPFCGHVPSSLLEVRTAEIDARIKSITDLLTAQSDSLQIAVTEISLSDCNRMNYVQGRAENSLSHESVNPDLARKIALHVRLVVWFGDNSSLRPPLSVLANEWADSRRLQELGFERRVSVNHFALTGPVFGYVWAWQAGSDAGFNFNAATISNPAPTEAGLHDIITAVQNSSARFADWLTTRAMAK